jgi:hypothetical protein
VLAFLCRQGVLQAVISNDTDMLARGVPVLIMPETVDATVLTQVRLESLLHSTGLTYGQFVTACMLMGSDYSGEGWPGMEAMAAIARARGGCTWTDVSGCDPTTMEAGSRLLCGSDALWETIVPEYQRNKWTAGPPPKEPDNLVAIATTQGWPTQWVSVLG